MNKRGKRREYVRKKRKNDRGRTAREIKEFGIIWGTEN